MVSSWVLCIWSYFVQRIVIDLHMFNRLLIGFILHLFALLAIGFVFALHDITHAFPATNIFKWKMRNGMISGFWGNKAPQRAKPNKKAFEK